jgi:hypothetical protein
MKKILIVAIILFSAIQVSNLNAFDYWSSTFDSDAEGWEAYLGPENEFISPDYIPEGYICYSREDNENVDSNWYLLKLDWEDWKNLYGGTISFDIKVTGEGDYKNPGWTVILDLPGSIGTYFYANIPIMPAKGEWITYRVPILDEIFTIYDPATVNTPELSNNLADIRGLDIRGDILIGDETTCIDNVKILPPVKENLLRGRWEVSIATDSGKSGDVTFYINNLELNPETGSYIANGCMKSSGGLAPLSLTANQIDGNNYEITCYSTVIPIDGRSPYVIQFLGNVQPYGNGAPDDIANGRVVAESFEGTWSADHHDRRKKRCPAVEIPPLHFRVDVRAQESLNNEYGEVFTGFDCNTNIVSSGVLVEIPDGSSMVLKPGTDIFSPNVDFISEFRFTDGIHGKYPIIGKQYSFTLLDASGNPIPGSTQTDIWFGGCIGASTDLKPTINTSYRDIVLTWNGVSGPGFDPINDIGFYQVEIFPTTGYGGAVYGANWVGVENHLIPWNSFTPPASGSPDGFDLGVGLNELIDGMVYMLRIVNHSFPPNDVGQGFECVVTDSDEEVYFRKNSDSVEIITQP